MYNEALQKNEELNKVVDDQSRQLVKYGELYMEAKSEKKALETKFETLNMSYIEVIKSNASKSVQLAAKYNRLLIIISVLITILTFLVLLYSYPDLLIK